MKHLVKREGEKLYLPVARWKHIVTQTNKQIIIRGLHFSTALLVWGWKKKSNVLFYLSFWLLPPPITESQRKRLPSCAANLTVRGLLWHLCRCFPGARAQGGCFIFFFFETGVNKPFHLQAQKAQKTHSLLSEQLPIITSPLNFISILSKLNRKTGSQGSCHVPTEWGCQAERLAEQS